MNNFYADQYNQENKEYFKKQSSNIANGFKEAWQAFIDPNRALFSGVVGALNSGLMVHPTFNNVVTRDAKTKLGKASTKLGKVVQLHWAPKQLLEQAREENKRESEFIQQWNTWASDPENSELLSMVNAAVAQSEFLKGRDVDANVPLFDIKNKKLEQFFTSISLARKVGIQDEYIGTLNKAYSDLGSIMSDPNSDKAKIYIEQAVKNGIISQEDVNKPEEVKKALRLIRYNSKKMLDMIPKISKLDEQISGQYGNLLDPQKKSALIYGHLQRENWIERKKDLSSITNNSNINSIASKIDAANPLNTNNKIDWELFEYGNSGTEVRQNLKYSYLQADNILNKFKNTLDYYYDKIKSSKRGTKEYSDALDSYRKTYGIVKQLSKGNKVSKSKWSKLEKKLINKSQEELDQEYIFSANDFLNASPQTQSRILNLYEKGKLSKNQTQIMSSFLEEISVDFEKNNGMSYSEAIHDLSRIEEGLNSLKSDLLRYQANPVEAVKDAKISEQKAINKQLEIDVNKKIEELSQLSDIDLLTEYSKLKLAVETIYDEKSDDPNVKLSISLLKKLNSIKLANNTELGNRLNKTADVRKDSDVLLLIQNDETLSDFEKVFLGYSYTFLIDNGINVLNSSEIYQKLLENNGNLLHKLFGEFSEKYEELIDTMNDGIQENEDIENKETLNTEIPQIYLTASDSGFVINGQNVRIDTFEPLFSKLPEYIKIADSNKINFKPEETTTTATNNEVIDELASEVTKEDLTEDEIKENQERLNSENTKVEETKVEPKFEGNTTKTSVNPENIKVSETDPLLFSVKDRSEFYWSSGTFKIDSAVVRYFAKHNVLNFLKSGRLRYFITGKRNSKDTVKDSRNASKLLFIIDKSLERDVYDSLKASNIAYDPKRHLPITLVTEDRNGTIMLNGKRYQVVTVIANGVNKRHPFMDSFMDRYILSDKQTKHREQTEDNYIIVTDENNNPITSAAAMSIPIGDDIASTNTSLKGHKGYVINTSTTNKFPLIDINSELTSGLPGSTPIEGSYRIFDKDGKLIDTEWEIVERKTTSTNGQIMNVAFLKNKKSTSDTEVVYIYSHSIESIDNDGFLENLKGFLLSLEDANIDDTTRKEIHSQLRDLLTNTKKRSKYTGAETINLTREQVLLFLQEVLKVKTGHKADVDDIIISQGKNFDAINLLKKFLVIPTEYLKIENNKIFINKPDPTKTVGRIKISNWVKIFDPEDVDTNNQEQIQQIADKITAELLSIPEVKFAVDYSDLTDNPGESTFLKNKKAKTRKRLLKDGILYTSGDTVKRPANLTKNLEEDGYTYLYDIPIIPPTVFSDWVLSDQHKDNLPSNSKEEIKPDNVIKDKTIVEVDGKKIDPITELKESENKKSNPEKELNALIKKVFRTINKLKNNVNKIIDSGDGKHYTEQRGKTTITYDRVTSVTKDTEEKEGGSASLFITSTVLGTKVDTFIRDFFRSESLDLSKYDFANSIVLEQFVKQLENLKQYFENNGETVISEELRLADPNMKLAGTTDIMTVDTKGKVRIYDIKTMKDNNFKKADTVNGGTKFDSTQYGKSKHQIYREQLSLYRIILNNTEGILAEELFIIPIELDYEDLDTQTHSIEILEPFKIEPLDEVGPYNMSGEKFVSPKIEETKLVEASNEDSFYDDLDDLNALDDKFLTTKNDMNESDLKDNDMSNHFEEFKILRELLPQLFDKEGKPLPEAIELQKAFINASEHLDPNDPNAEKAYGKYNNHKITLKEIAKRGTVYHEAIHYILDTFFSPVEVDIFLRKIKNDPVLNALSSIKDTEEQLAEVFRRGLNNEIDDKNTIFSDILKNNFIQKVFFRIRSLLNLNPKTARELFYRIRKGEFSNKVPKFQSTKETKNLLVENTNNTKLDELDRKIQNPENNITELVEKGIFNYTNENGNPCASIGLQSGISKGSSWIIVKDYSGKTHKEGGIKTKIKVDDTKIDIEVENNELHIQNSNGDIAIVPSKYAIEVKGMIAGQCWNCVDAFVKQLPEL